MVMVRGLGVCCKIESPSNARCYTHNGSLTWLSEQCRTTMHMVKFGDIIWAVLQETLILVALILNKGIQANKERWDERNSVLQGKSYVLVNTKWLAIKIYIQVTL